MYYEINGKVLCTSCRRQIEASLRGGSGFARFIKAVVFGTGAAIAGAALYFIARRMTGGNWGIVAVLVGFMVGGAVRKGTGNRGGMLYQFLSVVLTYFAIGLMIVSLVFEAQFKGARQQQEQAKAVPVQVPKDAPKGKIQPKAPAIAANGGERAKGVAPPKQPPGIDAPAKAVEAAAAEKKSIPVTEIKDDAVVDADEDAEEDADIEDHWLKWLLFAGLIAVSICVVPIVSSIHAPISGLIYCFALWQAWQMNRPARIGFNGPFQVGKGRSDPSELEGIDDVG